MNRMVLGILCLLAAVVLMIMGHMWALVLFLVGFGLMAAHSARMLRGGGYRSEGAFFNGLNGQGRQQSEVSRDSAAPWGYEDKPGNVWDQAEGK